MLCGVWRVPVSLNLHPLCLHNRHVYNHTSDALSPSPLFSPLLPSTHIPAVYHKGNGGWGVEESGVRNDNLHNGFLTKHRNNPLAMAELCLLHLTP